MQERANFGFNDLGNEANLCVFVWTRKGGQRKASHRNYSSGGRCSVFKFWERQGAGEGLDDSQQFHELKYFNISVCMVVFMFMDLKFFVDLFFSLETRSLAKTGTKFPMQSKITLNFWFSCFYHPCAGIVGMNHHTWLIWCWTSNPVFYMLGKQSTNWATSPAIMYLFHQVLYCFSLAVGTNRYRINDLKQHKLSLYSSRDMKLGAFPLARRTNFFLVCRWKQSIFLGSCFFLHPKKPLVIRLDFSSISHPLVPNRKESLL